LPTLTSEIQSKRKRLKKKVQRQRPGTDLRWFHGVLHDFGRRGVGARIAEPQPVSGIEMLPKDGGTARSFSEVHSPRFHQPPREEYHSRSAFVSRQQMRAPVISSITYANLSRAFDYDGECFNCHHYPNHAQERNTTDQGRKQVIICSACGQVQRPR